MNELRSAAMYQIVIGVIAIVVGAIGITPMFPVGIGFLLGGGVTYQAAS